jgi:sterol desaturase/sphingolipid hydroxylase (fatty acid hydroxylase superfamily)
MLLVSSSHTYFSARNITGVSVAEHDWHHEKFLQNYSLSYKYLDKLLGTYHPGREAGTGKIFEMDGNKKD